MPETAIVYTKRGNQPILVDADAYKHLSQHTWCLSRGYALTRTKDNRKTMLMHRMLLGLTQHDGIHVDHINGDPLDNRRENLRTCTLAENNRNVSGRGTRKSKYKGVCPNKKSWMAQITFERKCHHLGTFKTQEEAALAYNAAALRLHGEFAYLNDVA